MEITDRIDSNFDVFVQELREWCKQPSISTQNEGMSEMADLVCRTLELAGLTVRRMPVRDGFPVIYAERRGRSNKTILFYNHYDVQPIEPLEAWHSHPFAAEIRQGQLYARGVADNKGCLLSRVHAIASILQAQGELPVTAKFLIEGEEEIGSPHLHSFVASHKDVFAADWCIWEYAAKNETGYPTATLGNKGMCYLELTAHGAQQDFHSMYAPIFPNPAWRLTWALASLKNELEEIQIEGFYEAVEPLSPEEFMLLDKIPVDESKLRESAGLDSLLGDVQGFELKKRLYGQPTCTISGLISGFQASGMKTIVPSVAKAKVDLRLVPRQHPTDVFEKVRRHLAKHGYTDIQVEMLAGVSPAKTTANDPLVEATVRSARRAYHQDILVLPTSPGTGPRDAFSEWTSMPIVGLGVGNINSRIHAPNENINLEDYREGIYHIALLIDELGKVNSL